MRRLLLFTLASCLLTLPAFAVEQATPEWIWTSEEAKQGEVAFFRKSFELTGDVKKAVLITACDDEMTLFVNGERVLNHKSWQQAISANLSGKLKVGNNVVAVRGKNGSSAAALIVRIDIESADGAKSSIVSDGSWKVSGRTKRGWQGAGFDDSDWSKPHSLGKLGVQPWGAIAFDPSALPKPQATPVERFSMADGFKVELLYSVPRTGQGSWVNMTVDPQGRLIVSDQGGGLYRITPGEDAESTQVEPLSVAIGSAQGLLCAFDSLYVVVNGNAAQGAGFYRCRDTNGDDQYDEVKLLRKMQGGGEHGPHAVILAPDGKSLYLCGGNHTEIPSPEGSVVPRNWQEDQLLPRMWDAGGHAVGRLAPGGWVCRTDPDGESFELVSVGFRNEFDIAFNADGELFTYDADMEWDIGSPWYRPTRICHVTSGSEFGWRSGTGKFPPYYPDSLPAAVDIGPGSPTGITFGTGAKFPAKYQKALFICDWSYGLIYAVHLDAEGSSYAGTFERFATASPLPVTDVVVNPKDGALYFTIGGRNTQSGFYRVTYIGDESTAPVSGKDKQHAADRQLRQQLESLHKEDSTAVATAWPHLANPDRFTRFAARIAIEHQPVESWQARALAEKDTLARITALLALARNGEPAVQGDLVAALNELEWAKLSHGRKLDLLRAYGLAFARMGFPNDAVKISVIEKLNGHYPANTTELNIELARVLIYLEAPDVVGKTLDLIAAAKTQEEHVSYLTALRTLKAGWSRDQRRAYFNAFNTAAAFRGGHSFSRFLVNIRKEAADLLGEEDRVALAKVIETQPASSAPDAAIKARPFVKKWAMDDLLSDATQLSGRDYARGREMFAAANCFKCHRFANQGGIIGPDLTGVGRRFNNQYLLESLLDPSKVISDQYQATVFITADGQTVIGKVANLSGDRIMVITNMLEPGNMTPVSASGIDEQMPSKVSMMPNGLLDTLSRDEILDLLAYLRSGGDPDHESFR